MPEAQLSLVVPPLLVAGLRSSRRPPMSARMLVTGQGRFRAP